MPPELALCILQDKFTTSVLASFYDNILFCSYIIFGTDGYAHTETAIVNRSQNSVVYIVELEKMPPTVDYLSFT